MEDDEQKPEFEIFFSVSYSWILLVPFGGFEFLLLSIVIFNFNNSTFPPSAMALFIAILFINAIILIIIRPVNPGFIRLYDDYMELNQKHETFSKAKCSVHYSDITSIEFFLDERKIRINKIETSFEVKIKGFIYSQISELATRLRAKGIDVQNRSIQRLF